LYTQHNENQYKELDGDIQHNNNNFSCSGERCFVESHYAERH
jgi:hypothetical protein